MSRARAQRGTRIVGTGARAEMFVRALVTEHADRCELVALADTNPTRMRAHNDCLAALGASPGARRTTPPTSPAMLAKERVDVLLVTHRRPLPTTSTSWPRSTPAAT